MSDFTLTAQPEMMRDAFISDCGHYRYSLGRRWAKGNAVIWIMLNPSSADALIDDATVRKCIGFSRRWGFFGSLVIVNLFSYRATNPDDMRRAMTQSVRLNGPQADDEIRRIREDYPIARVVGAWGNLAPWLDASRTVDVIGLLGDPDVLCLGKTKSGEPRHPVRLAYSTPLEPL